MINEIMAFKDKLYDCFLKPNLLPSSANNKIRIDSKILKSPLCVDLSEFNLYEMILRNLAKDQS